jgi:hypothetical protein
VAISSTVPQIWGFALSTANPIGSNTHELAHLAPIPMNRANPRQKQAPLHPTCRFELERC